MLCVDIKGNYATGILKKTEITNTEILYKGVYDNSPVKLSKKKVKKNQTSKTELKKRILD